MGGPWPAPTGSGPTLKCDAKFFEVKVAQDTRNQFDGVKGGEAWKVLVRGYLLSRLPMMGHLLRWAECHGNREINPQMVNDLSSYLDEEPYVVSHLLWGFLNVNLVGKAREIFCNVGDSQGFEVWRRINTLI